MVKRSSFGLNIRLNGIKNYVLTKAAYLLLNKKKIKTKDF